VGSVACHSRTRFLTVTSPLDVSYLPVFTIRHNSTGEILSTTDPGRALVTGLWSYIGKLKGPRIPIGEQAKQVLADIAGEPLAGSGFKDDADIAASSERRAMRAKGTEVDEGNSLLKLAPLGRAEALLGGRRTSCRRQWGAPVRLLAVAAGDRSERA